MSEAFALHEVLCDDQGRPVSAGHIWNFDAQALDATHPEVEAHLERIADTIAHRWGFGFVKIDWCYSGALPARRHDPKATRAQALRRGLEAIRRGLGNEPFLLGCGCPFGPAIGVVDAMRIGPDTAPSWEPLIWNMPWASPFLKSERSLASLRNSIRHTLNLSTLHGRWWWNDPDVVMVRQNETRLSEDEVKSNISLVGLQGGLVVNSDDLTRLPPERVDLSALLTPILSPGARALDLLRDEMPEYYELAMERPWGRWRVVDVFNWTGAPETRTLRRAEMGLPADTRLHVFDFWNRTYWLQAASDVVLHGIPAHGCRLLRIAEDDRRPALVGDTLHVVQGGEVETFEARADGIEIHIIDLQRAAAGELWFWLPSPPVRVLCGGSPIAARRIAPDVYALPLQLQGPAKIQISL